MDSITFIIQHWSDVVTALGNVAVAVIGITVALRPLVFILRQLSKIPPLDKIEWDDKAIDLFERGLDAVYDLFAKVSGVNRKYK